MGRMLAGSESSGPRWRLEALGHRTDTDIPTRRRWLSSRSVVFRSSGQTRSGPSRSGATAEPGKSSRSTLPRGPPSRRPRDPAVDKAGREKVTATELVNVNTASERELEALSGIGQDS